MDDIHTIEQDIAQGINVVRHKYSNDPNFRGNPLFLKFCKKCLRSGHSIALSSCCPKKRYTKPLDKPKFQKQTFNQALTGNQNFPNRQVTSNNMTGKPLPWSYRSRSNSKETTQDTEVQKNLQKITRNLITVIAISDHPVEPVHHTQDQIPKIIRNITLDHNHITIMETEIVRDNRFHKIDFEMLEIILFLTRSRTNRQYYVEH